MLRIKHILNIITYVYVATAYASVISYVDIVHSLAFAVLFFVSIYLDQRRIVKIPRWLLNIASFLVLALAAARMREEYFVEPILDTLTILIAIKLIEEKKNRDYLQVYMLGMFLLIGSSLMSLSIVFLLYLLVLLVLSTMSLVLLSYFSHDPEMVVPKENAVKILQHASLICCIAIPASAIFFIILPRTNYPILDFLNKGGFGHSGFTDHVELGDIATIQEDASPIFRVEMDRVPESALYWRGIVMDRFDGVSWRSEPERDRPTRLPMRGERIVQTIYLEPYGENHLFALDKPETVLLRSLVPRSSDLTFSLKHPIFERVKYTATSVLTNSIPDDSMDRRRYLDLPPDFSPKIRKLTGEIVGNKGKDEAIGALVKFLNRDAFKYSLKNLPVSESPLEDFLFVGEKGNCEYFASALAVMLRMAGIPARLVGGYKGGYYNAAGKYYLVLQRNAHVWVEACTAEGNWMRLDPTPYTRENPATRYENSFFLKMKLVMDTFNYYWNKFVLTYDFTRQLQLVNAVRSTFSKTNFKFDLRGIPVKKVGFGATFVLGLACLAALLLVKPRTRAERILSRFLRKMARLGYRKRNNEGLEEFLARIDESDVRAGAEIFVAEFQAIYYADRTLGKEEADRLEGHINAIRQAGRLR